jgi:hypothetical protein
LVERLNGIEEVTGSNPVGSISFLFWRSGLTADFHHGLMTPGHVYKVRGRKDKRGVDLISDAQEFACCSTLRAQRSTSKSEQNIDDAEDDQ